MADNALPAMSSVVHAGTRRAAVRALAEHLRLIEALRNYHRLSLQLREANQSGSAEIRAELIGKRSDWAHHIAQVLSDATNFDYETWEAK